MLALCALMSATACCGEPAVVFDDASLSWDEQCAAEALQGLVNRKGPRLFLGRMDDPWLGIYAKRNGLTYTPLVGLRELLQRFGGETKGLVAYDAGVDGARYVAITLAGVESLIPASDEMLRGESPGLRASALWPGADFATLAPDRLAEWRPAASPQLRLLPGVGLELTEGNAPPAEPWSFVSYGPLTVDLDQFPYLEAAVESLEGQGAQWAIKLTWDRDGNGVISGGEDDLPLTPARPTGVVRWNVRELAGVEGPLTLDRIQLHVLGEGARVVFRSVRFVTADGTAPEAGESWPLTDLGLPIVRDLRGQFADSVAAYDWALREVMPRCNRRYAHAVGGPCEEGLALVGPMRGMDWATMHRGFVFNLVPCPEQKPSYGNALVGGSPAQAAMYVRILAALKPSCQITGYGEPEDYWCKLISEHGHYSIHYGHNWSFHHQVPQQGPLRQKGTCTPETVRVEADKYYVCFMTSEGDTMKGPLPFFYGSWFDPDRGRVPMNWGINPLMAQMFPAMLAYYYDTATPDDYFFAGCSGAGYTYPDYMPNVAQFARHTGEACRASDISCVDLWGAQKLDVRRRYAKSCGAMAYSANGGAAAMSLPTPGTLWVDHGLLYWQIAATGGGNYVRDFRDDAKRAQAVDWLVSRIEDIADRHTPPFVILVYADLHSYDRLAMVHREAADRLDRKRFKPARLDEAMAAVTAWARGRVLVGKTGINERLAAAALQGVLTTYRLSVLNGGAERRTVEVSLGEARRKVAVPGGGTREVELPLQEGGAEGAAVWVGKDPYPLHLTVVPTEAPIAAAEFAGLWDAVDLRHSGGAVAPRADAMWGRAWRSPEPGEAQGHIVFGPYSNLPKGKYLVAFRLMLEEAPTTEGDEPVVTLDINTGGYEGLGEALGKTPVSARALGKPGEWTWVSVPIEWPGPPNLLETRVWWHGNARVLVDRVAAFGVGESR